PLGLALAVRPTNLFPSLILTAYVAVRHRGELLRWVAFGGLAIAAVAAVHLATYGLLVPPYYLPSNQPIAPWSDLGAIALAQLASPNRGLLVFSPVAVFAFLGPIVALRRGRLGRLEIASVAIVAVHWFAISRAGMWWAGHSYGPRFWSDVLPFLALLAIPVLRGDAVSSRRGNAILASSFALLVAFSF